MTKPLAKKSLILFNVPSFSFYLLKLEWITDRYFRYIKSFNNLLPVGILFVCLQLQRSSVKD